MDPKVDLQATVNEQEGDPGCNTENFSSSEKLEIWKKD